MIAIWGPGNPAFCNKCEEGRNRVVDLDNAGTNPLHYVFGRSWKCEAPDSVFEEEFERKIRKP